jgi:gliding motility-associated protein GldM
VFIAMLALNIGKEVLATIGVINEDLTNSINQFKDNSSVIYKKFDDLGVSEPAWAEALPVINELKKYSDEYSQYLNSVQDFLLSSDKEGKNFKRVVENKSDDSKPDVDMTNYQIMDASVALDEKFFDGDKYTEDGKEYVANFQNFQSNLLVVIDSLKTLKIFKDYSAGFDLDKIELEKRFEFTEFKLNSEGKELPYLDYEFKGFPLIASLSKITKTHNNLRYIENKILNTALGNIRVGSGGGSIVDLVPTLSQDQQFFTGQTFGGKIILAQESDLQVFNSIDLTLNGPGNSNRTLVEDVDFTVESGQIVFKNRISRAGLYTLKGKISKRGENGTVEYDISEMDPPVTFTIIDEPSSANVEAIRMNILYIGLSNPVNISLPGVIESSLVQVPSPDSNVSLNRNVKVKDKEDGANFYAKPLTKGNAFIQVRGRLSNGTNITSNRKLFRVKKIEDGVGAIVGADTYKAGSSLSQFNILEGQVSGFKPDDFDYDFNVEVTKFTISVGNNQSLTITGNYIEGLAADYVRRASSGDIIIFSSIEAIGWEGNNKSDAFDYTINRFDIKKK